MKLIKRHKGLFIVSVLALILIIILFIIFARMIFSSGNTVYGDRLAGLVKIDSSDTEELTNETKELDGVVDVSVRTQGKIIYITITYANSVSKEKAKEIASSTYKYYSEDVIAYYDFEYLLTQEKEESDEEDSSVFTIAGTKHPDNDYISWTKN